MVRVTHPESEWVRSSLFLRALDFPPEAGLTKTGQLRWLCLSLGLLSEHESRDTVLEVLDGILTLVVQRKESPSTAELSAWIEGHSKKPVSEKLLRYHVNRFIEMGLLVRKNQRLFLNQSPEGARFDLVDAFSFGVKRPAADTLNQIEKVLEKLSAHYAKKR